VSLITAAIALAAAPGASAGVLVSTATDCATYTYERPFVRWLDLANYALVPNGNFESGTGGWSLSGAEVTSGNEPYYVHGSGESGSLALPAGSSATTPSMCVGLEHPALRFFARRTGGSLLSTLKVEVLFETAAGKVQSLPIGLLTGGSSFQHTLPVLVVANLLPLLPNQHTAVAFRLTPEAGSAWQIDDVYLDPHRRH
jgi:hypothetical protein